MWGSFPKKHAQTWKCQKCEWTYVFINRIFTDNSDQLFALKVLSYKVGVWFWELWCGTVMLENCKSAPLGRVTGNTIVNFHCYRYMYFCYIYLSSYSMLLTLQYGGQMERARVACECAEETGMPIRQSERVVDSELFLDEYPRWGLGTPH